MTDMTDQELDRLMRHVLMDGVEQERTLLNKDTYNAS